MGAIIERDDLKEASFLRSVTSKEHRYVRLSWGGNELHLYSYSGSILTRVAVPCETTDVQEAVLLSDKWWDVISYSVPGQITIDKLKTNMRVSSGSQEVKLRMVSPENFVDVARVFSCSGNTLGVVMATALKAGMERVEYAMADSSRPNLQGMFAVLRDGAETLGLYATDGVKVAGAKVPAKIEQTVSHIIPASSVKHWIRLLPQEGPVRIFGDENLVGIEFKEQWSVTQVLASNFPPVEEFLKPMETANFIADKAILERAVKQSQTFIDDITSSQLEFRAGGTTLVLSSSGAGGEFQALINAKVKEPMEALVNPAMVLDVLRKIPGEYVAVAQEEPLKPIFMRGIQDFGISIVMPIRRRPKATSGEEEGDF